MVAKLTQGAGRDVAHLLSGLRKRLQHSIGRGVEDYSGDLRLPSGAKYDLTWHPNLAGMLTTPCRAAAQSPSLDPHPNAWHLSAL